MPVKVTIFEDRASVREALALLIKSAVGLELAGAYAHCNNLIKDIESSLPDVVLMDIEMPGMNGIDAVKILKQRHPDIIIIMQTVFEDDDKIFNAI
jgi:DNA-binding NarL/FixJ family response regulator